MDEPPGVQDTAYGLDRRALGIAGDALAPVEGQVLRRAWSAEQRADELMGRRDELVARLPRKLFGAR